MSRRRGLFKEYEMADKLDCQELEDLADWRLMDGLAGIASIYFNKRHVRKAVDGMMKVVYAFCDSVKGPDPARHYKNKAELIKIAGSEKRVQAMINYGLLVQHHKWPMKMADHLQAPYKPNAEVFSEVRRSEIYAEQFALAV